MNSEATRKREAPGDNLYGDARDICYLQMNHRRVAAATIDCSRETHRTTRTRSSTAKEHHESNRFPLCRFISREREHFLRRCTPWLFVASRADERLKDRRLTNVHSFSRIYLLNSKCGHPWPNCVEQDHRLEILSRFVANHRQNIIVS